jgi:putative hydrolase of the HAD superfamily
VAPPNLLPLHTVTFDCWSTLIYEAHAAERGGAATRAKLFAEFTGSEPARASAALATAWRHHQTAWHARKVFAGTHMTRHALDALGLTLTPERFAELLALLEAQILERQVVAIDDARLLLQALQRAGIRRALICDTGFTPGHVVRQLLDRVGLLELLEVTIFSDEIGVPKPDARAFEAALSALGTAPVGALHVGDLRRSDVAGARAAGMASVRFRGHHDDAEAGPGANAGVLDCRTAGCTPVCPRPEADAVVGSYAELAALLGHSLTRTT